MAVNTYVSGNYDMWEHTPDENRESYTVSFYNVTDDLIWKLDKFLRTEAQAELKLEHKKITRIAGSRAVTP